VRANHLLLLLSIFLFLSITSDILHADKCRNALTDVSLHDKVPAPQLIRQTVQITEEIKLLSAIYILWLRELKRYMRSRVEVVASMGQPLLFLLALGFGFEPVFQQAGHGSYLQFMAPGVVGMTVVFSAVFSGGGMLWDRQFGFLKETFVAPVPRLYVMLGRTLGGATVAMIQGFLFLLICLIAGFRPHDWTSTILGFFFIAMIAIVFSAVGTAIGSVIKDVQGFQITINFMIMPLFLFSGALFPLTNLRKVLSVIMHLDPLTYGIDGMRGALIGTWHFSFMFDTAVLSVLAAIFLCLGAYLFSRIQM